MGNGRIRSRDRVRAEGFSYRSDGSEKIANTVTFTGEQDKPVHRVVVTNFGISHRRCWIYRFKLSYQRTGEENWVDAADYPLQVSYAPAAVPTPAVQ